MTDEIPVKKILVLSANPKGTKPLRLGEEIREIKDGLRRARERERFIIESAEAVRYRDIRRAILDYEPHIVHFSGHGLEEGLVFEDETGREKLVEPQALAGLFKLFADQVECVLLNACYSEHQAKAIAQHINYVIGMSHAIGDKAAIEFAVGFYDALLARRSVEIAYQFGCNAIQMASIPEHLTPKLLKQAEAELKKLQNYDDIKDEYVNLLKQEEEQQEAQKRRQEEQVEAHRLQRQQEQQEAERLQRQKQKTNDLPSEKGVDYTKLRDLLAAGKWKDADQETLAVMLQATGREKEGWLDYESIKKFSCTDLRTIDQLWVKYSNGRFGFSVQKRIWESVGKDYGKFGDRVGWRQMRTEIVDKWFGLKQETQHQPFWLNQDQLTYDTSAPEGHLPLRNGHLHPSRLMSYFVKILIGDHLTRFDPGLRFSSLASRLVNCNI
ncbi:GUN4 domain-containing protein [Tolypothrix sp. NIES-4075]|uniref:GUN4 domain-containing protein n=1 Tax=Tolypothrix sp. NIES-4075 TaxID=2005459 RepID=UPI000B5C87BE|nr:GUN4 domain-containing protein [Tolypothrix sp. NIES-4075]GAX43823.1 GUN4 domain-containing protein [Tolypothrix sp. NIES-4075]